MDLLSALSMGVGGGSFLTLVILLVVLMVVSRGVRVVPQGTEYTVERFGRYTTTLKPGLNLIIPIVDRVGAKVNMKERVLDVPSQEIITKDNAMVRVDGVVFFQVLDAAKSAYEVDHLDFAILNLIMTNLRTVMGSLDLDELLSRRDHINARLLEVVDEATTPWGIKITRVEIKDIAPPVDLVDSMARQMKAERERRAAILEAEGVRQAQILKAEGEKQSMILSAEGRKEATFRDSEAREREGQAEAAVTTVLSDAIARGNSQSLQYLIAQNYVDAFKQLAEAPNQKIILLPFEATQLLGALGGVGELLRSVGGGDGDSSSGAHHGGGGSTKSKKQTSNPSRAKNQKSPGVLYEALIPKPNKDQNNPWG